MNPLDRIIRGETGGEPDDTPADQVFSVGRIKSISLAGMTFTLPDWDGGKFLFGPAPWTNSGAAGEPNEGSKCLVVFPGGEPWVIGWWPS